MAAARARAARGCTAAHGVAHPPRGPKPPQRSNALGRLHIRPEGHSGPKGQSGREGPATRRSKAPRKSNDDRLQTTADVVFQLIDHERLFMNDGVHDITD